MKLCAVALFCLGSVYMHRRHKNIPIYVLINRFWQSQRCALAVVEASGASQPCTLFLFFSRNKEHFFFLFRIVLHSWEFEAIWRQEHREMANRGVTPATRASIIAVNRGKRRKLLQNAAKRLQISSCKIRACRLRGSVFLEIWSL